MVISLPQADQAQSQSQIMCTQSYGSSQLSSEADLLSNSMILPLSNIIQLDQVSPLKTTSTTSILYFLFPNITPTLTNFQISYCVTVAKIVKVNSTKHGWYFFACHKCPKIARGDKPPYTCEDGHNTETEIVRYIS